MTSFELNNPHFTSNPKKRAPTASHNPDSYNPRGPKADDKKAVHYTQVDAERWRLEALYGKQD
jgi:hypothetical protein